LSRVRVTMFATQTQTCIPYLLFLPTCNCLKHNTIDFCHGNARIIPIAMLSSFKVFLPAVNIINVFLISNFRRVLNVVFFLLGDSPASEFYMPTFRKTLFNFIGDVSCLHRIWRWNSVPKRRHRKFRRRRIIQKKDYNTNLFWYSRKVHETFGRFNNSWILPIDFRQFFPI
jgi:hypothetical protein